MRTAGIFPYAVFLFLPFMSLANSKTPIVTVTKPDFEEGKSLFIEGAVIGSTEWGDIRQLERLDKNYDITGPLSLRISRDENTGEYRLYCSEDVDGIEDRYDIVFADMRLVSNNQEKKLSGKKIKYQNCVGWTSDGLSSLKDGDVIKGVVKGKIAVEKYVVENLNKDSVINSNGFSLKFKKYDGKPRLFCPLGAYGLWEVTEENKDRMWYAVGKLHDNLSPEDRTYIEKIQKAYHEENRYPGSETISKYKKIALKTPSIRVLDIWRMPTRELCDKCIDGTHESDEDKRYCRVERGISHERAFQIDRLEVGFDCIQDGNDVFPLGMELMKYEPGELEFEIVYKGSGLKKLGDPDKPNPNEVRENSIGMKFVWIPAGQFMMGSALSISESIARYGENGAYPYEHPQHSVTISKGFWMGQYEVTQLEYKTIMGHNPSNYRYKCPHCDDFLDANLIKEGALEDVAGNHPVESMSWENAMAFCEKMSEKDGFTYTLPTEAQWEYACRAGTTSPFFFGDDVEKLGDYAWYNDNTSEKVATHPVGEKAPNPWGLYDIYGNVAELCLDWFDSEYYSKGEKVDPFNENPGDGKYKLRSRRGGSIVSSKTGCRSADRDFYIHHEKPQYGPLADQGFRVICERD